MRIAAIIAFAALTPMLAVAEDDPGGMTCARFAMLDVPEQVAALSTLEPLGDDINASDTAASEQWAAAVTAACRDRADTPLPEAARDAIGE